MTDVVKPEVVRKTKDSLGKYIRKPPLTEKLLKKPPFRFLHDIVTAVIRETGFLDGVFTAEELNHENIKDKDGKVAFLQKLIDAIKAVTGTPLTVRPTKIVAGHEPTKTNELLQAIGRALDSKLSSAEYVEQLHGKARKEKPTSKAPKENVQRAKPKEVVQDRSQPLERSKSRDADKRKVDAQKKPISDTKVQKEKSFRIKSNTREQITANRKSEPENEERPEAESVPEPMPLPQPEPLQLPEKELAMEEPVEANKQNEQILLTKRTESPTQKEEVENKRPSSAHPGHRKASASSTNRTPNVEGRTGDLGKHNKFGAENPKQSLASVEPQDGNLLLAAQMDMEPWTLGNKSDSKAKEGSSPIPKSAHPQTTVQPRSARPPSARPAAPRIRDRGEVVLQEETSTAAGKINVITESDTMKEQEEDETFMVVEQQPAIVSEIQSPEPKPSEETKTMNDTQHGHLVAQILETKKELEDDGQQQGHSKKVEIEWENGRRREREVAVREVERLQNSIQTLTRAANPLGKLMDFLQEDVDSMQRELESWQATNALLAVQLKMEQSLTEESIKPLKAHLQQLEQSIKEQLNQLSVLKATVLQNDERMNSLLVGQNINLFK